MICDINFEFLLLEEEPDVEPDFEVDSEDDFLELECSIGPVDMWLLIDVFRLVLCIES